MAYHANPALSRASLTRSYDSYEFQETLSGFYSPRAFFGVVLFPDCAESLTLLPSIILLRIAGPATMEITPADGTANSRRLLRRMLHILLLPGRFRPIRPLRSNRRRFLLTAYFTSRCRIISGLSTPARGICSGTITSQPTMETISGSVESPCTKVGFTSLLPMVTLFR